MHSDLIGKIAKARRYAQEPERVALVDLQATFHGGNHDHELTLHDGHLSCSCDFFRTRGTCAHTMALQVILRPMLPASALAADEEVLSDGYTHMHSEMISKVAKARRYAAEPERIAISALQAVFHGGNHDHQIALRGDSWSCSCDCFHGWGTCPHTMALQDLLRPMLSVVALEVAGSTLNFDYALAAS